MVRNDRGVYVVFGVLGTIILTGFVARFLPQTAEVKVLLLAWQQLLFIGGGLFGAQAETLKRPQPRAWGKGLLYGVGIFLSNSLLGAISTLFARLLLGPETVQQLAFAERLAVESLVFSGKPLVVLGMILLLVLGAPLGEELFFRGLLIELWRKRLGARWAIFLSALLFAVLHFYTLQFVPVLVAGMFLGLIFVRTNNIYVSVTAHAFVNGLALVLLLGRL